MLDKLPNDVWSPYFFRFITKKYSSTTKKIEAEPATACTGALVWVLRSPEITENQKLAFNSTLAVHWNRVSEILRHFCQSHLSILWVVALKLSHTLVKFWSADIVIRCSGEMHFLLPCIWFLFSNFFCFTGNWLFRVSAGHNQTIHSIASMEIAGQLVINSRRFACLVTFWTNGHVGQYRSGYLASLVSSSC